jgi:hypothetical protein
LESRRGVVEMEGRKTMGVADELIGEEPEEVGATKKVEEEPEGVGESVGDADEVVETEEVSERVSYEVVEIVIEGVEVIDEVSDKERWE